MVDSPIRPPHGRRRAGDIAGPDGNLWFTDMGTNKIGRMTPGAPNTITEFPLHKTATEPGAPQSAENPAGVPAWLRYTRPGNFQAVVEGGLGPIGRLRLQLGQVSAQQGVGDLPIAPAVLFDQTGIA